MKSISWIGSKGQTIELRAECETYMVDKTADLDGDIITNWGKHIDTIGDCPKKEAETPKTYGVNWNRG